MFSLYVFQYLLFPYAQSVFKQFATTILHSTDDQACGYNADGQKYFWPVFNGQIQTPILWFLTIKMVNNKITLHCYVS